MVCTYCGSKTEVVNSRHQKRLNQVWRRRHCLNCGAIFSTHEATSYEGSWRVQTATSGLQPFLRDKLLLSVHKSLEHRPDSTTDASAITATIVSQLGQLSDKGLITSKQIIKTVQETLDNFDKPAAVHYAAFHKL
jgi:transcriptional regulator NrdR family protein